MRVRTSQYDVEPDGDLFEHWAPPPSWQSGEERCLSELPLSERTVEILRAHELDCVDDVMAYTRPHLEAALGAEVVAALAAALRRVGGGRLPARRLTVIGSQRPSGWDTEHALL